MKCTSFVLATACGIALGLGSATAGGLTAAGELDHARANARAGGPLSERDAELLRRHGCLSGTDNDFCRRLEGRGPDRRPLRKRRHRG